MGSGRCLWLPDKLREYGLRVIVVQGWEKRGAATMNPKGVVDRQCRRIVRSG